MCDVLYEYRWQANNCKFETVQNIFILSMIFFCHEGGGHAAQTPEHKNIPVLKTQYQS